MWLASIAAAAPGTVAPVPSALKSILASAPGKPTAYALIVDLDTGATILDVRGDRPATPASVAKMFTTAAVLRTMPHNRRLTTRIATTARRPMAANKSAKAARPSKSARPSQRVKNAEKASSSAKSASVATLAIIGGGDPSLTVARLGRFARTVADAGIVRIDRLLIDSTLFDDALPRGYDEKNTDSSYRAPIDALQVGGSTITVMVKPGPLGQSAQVEVRPPSPAIRIINKAKTAKGRADHLQVRSRGKGRHTEVVVTGKIGQRRRAVAVRRRVHNARFFAGWTFRTQLEARGVVVKTIAWGQAPIKGLKNLHVHRSKPLLQLVATCAKTSHNGYAESLFKLLGAERIGRPGTAAKAEAAMQQALVGFGIQWSQVRQGNGSGLYHANSATPRALIGLLRGMFADKAHGKAWREALAISAVDGTLRGRLGGAATRRRIFAKTGTLDDATALSGYAMGERRRYAFAFFFNQVKGKPGPLRRVHDRLLVALLDPDGKVRAAAKAAKAASRPTQKKRRRPLKVRKGTRSKVQRRRPASSRKAVRPKVKKKPAR